MSTDYIIKKCKSFGFVNNINEFLEKYSYKDDNIYVISSDDALKNISDKINIITLDNLKDIININNLCLVIDFNSDIFNDIHISYPKDKKNEISKEQQITTKEIQQQLIGQSTQLDAFSNNLFAIIYGKKSANIQSCNAKQNHDVLDSLARNGVVCTPNTSNVLSIQIIVDYLQKCKSFRIFAMHDGFDGKYIEHEYPSEISHPSYIIGKGEILAVFYRYLLINFFGYCSIITDSMRENAYIF